MTSRFRCFEEQRRILFCRRKGKASRREKGIIVGVQKQSRNCYSIQILARAGLLPIIRCISKTMDRCGVAIVEFLKCPDRSNPTRIDLIRKSARLGFNFSDQALDKAPKIDPIAPTGDRGLARLQRDRSAQRSPPHRSPPDVDWLRRDTSGSCSPQG